MRFALLLAATSLVGCAARLPQYPPMEPAQALETMRARDATVRTIMAPATVTMRDPDGASISFDAAIVARWPDHLRLRAWKFGAAAFDLTFTPEGLWVYIPDDARRRAGEHADFRLTADQFGRIWQLIGPRAMEGASATSNDSATSSRLLVTRPLAPSGHIEFDIDRATLTIRQCRFIDDSGSVRQTLTLGGYRLFNDQAGDIVWPMRVEATGTQGAVSIRLGTPEFNTEPPADAFTPPRRATKQPERATD
jgi:hypothetical protein